MVVSLMVIYYMVESVKNHQLNNQKETTTKNQKITPEV